MSEWQLYDRVWMVIFQQSFQIHMYPPRKTPLTYVSWLPIIMNTGIDLNIKNIKVIFWQHFTLPPRRYLQCSDPAIGALLRWKQQNKWPYGTEICSNSPETRHYWNYWNSIEIHGDLLFKRNHSGDGGSGKLQFLVPQKMRNTILRQMHDSVIGAHLGRRKTTSKVLQNYYWFQLRDDVQEPREWRFLHGQRDHHHWERRGRQREREAGPGVHPQKTTQERSRQKTQLGWRRASANQKGQDRNHTHNCTDAWGGRTSYQPGF